MRRIIRIFVCALVASLSFGSLAEPITTVAPSSEGTRAEPGSPPPPVQEREGFDFGTYSRIGIGADLRGHEGFPTNVVSHGSRLEEAPYIELDFYYSRAIGGDPSKRWRIVLAPAFAGGDLFRHS